MDFRALACAEFPNDNPSLHRGAIWFCPEVAGPPVFERSVDGPPVLAGVVVEAVPEPATDPAPPVVEADDDNDDIEIVDDLSFDDAVDESPVPPPPEEADVEPPAAEDPFAALAGILEEVARASGADVSALGSLKALLGQTRLDANAPAEHARLRTQALAWQGVLRGESEDFDACGGSMLDDWCANLVALVLGNPSRAESLKRDLRRRGIAAFGLVEQAA